MQNFMTNPMVPLFCLYDLYVLRYDWFPASRSGVQCTVTDLGSSTERPTYLDLDLDLDSIFLDLEHVDLGLDSIFLFNIFFTCMF